MWFKGEGRKLRKRSVMQISPVAGVFLQVGHVIDVKKNLP